MPARGRNPTDPLKAQTPHGKGRLPAGPQVRTTRTATAGPAFPTTPRPCPPFLHDRITRAERPERLPVQVGPGDLQSAGRAQAAASPR